MSSNGSADTKTLTLVSLQSSMEEKLRNLIQQSGELENSLSCLADMVQEDRQLFVQLNEVLMDHQSISQKLRGLRQEICTDLRIRELSNTGNKQDESLVRSLGPPLPPSGVPFKFPPTE